MLKQEQQRIIVISGPSGTGKSTLIKMLMHEHSNTLQFSVSTTTRPPRPGEINGVDYNFLSIPEFQKRAKEGYFLETADVHGNLYGTSKEAIIHSLSKSSENMCLLDIDVQGALSVSQIYPYSKRIFVLPPSLEELEKRLTERGDTKEKDVQLRLSNAIEELKFITLYNYFVVNSNTHSAVKDLKQAIYGQTQ